MNSGARTAAVQRTDRNRRAGGEHRSTREWRAGRELHSSNGGHTGGTCRAGRSPCPYRGRRMNGGARTAAVPPEATAPTETDAQAGSFTPATEVAQAEPAAPEEAPAPTRNGA